MKTLINRFALAAVLVALAILTGIVATRIVLEERLLREHYPEYAAYVESTKAVVPYLL